MTSPLLRSRQRLLRGEPLRVQLLNAFDLEAQPFDQKRQSQVAIDGRVSDLDGHNHRIAGPVHFLVGLQLQCRQDLALQGLGVGVVSSAAENGGKPRRQHSRCKFRSIVSYCLVLGAEFGGKFGIELRAQSSKIRNKKRKKLILCREKRTGNGTHSNGIWGG